jgi:hypothetical protein
VDEPGPPVDDGAEEVEREQARRRHSRQVAMPWAS